MMTSETSSPGTNDHVTTERHPKNAPAGSVKSERVTMIMKSVRGANTKRDEVALLQAMKKPSSVGDGVANTKRIHFPMMNPWTRTIRHQMMTS